MISALYDSGTSSSIMEVERQRCSEYEKIPPRHGILRVVLSVEYIIDFKAPTIAERTYASVTKEHKTDKECKTEIPH